MIDKKLLVRKLDDIITLTIPKDGSSVTDFQIRNIIANVNYTLGLAKANNLEDKHIIDDAKYGFDSLVKCCIYLKCYLETINSISTEVKKEIL